MAWSDPRTWLERERPTSALLNQEVRENFKAIGDPWQSYVPVLGAITTAPTLGTGAVQEGGYIHAGRLCIWYFRFIFGTGMNAGSGNYTVSLPVNAWTGVFPHVLAKASITDISAGSTKHRVGKSVGSNSIIQLASEEDIRVNNTTFAWATGDYIAGVGVYQAASAP